MPVMFPSLVHILTRLNCHRLGRDIIGHDIGDVTDVIGHVTIGLATCV